MAAFFGANETEKPHYLFLLFNVWFNERKSFCSKKRKYFLVWPKNGFLCARLPKCIFGIYIGIWSLPLWYKMQRKSEHFDGKSSVDIWWHHDDVDEVKRERCSIENVVSHLECTFNVQLEMPCRMDNWKSCFVAWCKSLPKMVGPSLWFPCEWFKIA